MRDKRDQPLRKKRVTLVLEDKTAYAGVGACKLHITALLPHNAGRVNARRSLLMPLPVETLTSEVLGLSTKDRATLLDSVIASLDQDKQRDAAWDALAAARDAEIESGQSQAVDGASVIARLRAELA